MNTRKKSLFRLTFKNFNWSFLNSVGGSIISFGFNIFYLNTFIPDQFGEIVIGYLILSFAIPLSELGLSGALIQRNIKDIKIDSAQSLSTLIAFATGLLGFFIVLFLGNSNDYLQSLFFSFVVFSTLIVTSLSFRYKVHLSIEMRYHVISKITIISSLLSHGITVSILFFSDSKNILILFNQRLLLALITLVLLSQYQKLKWRFSLQFKQLIDEIRFGISLTMSNVLENIYKQGLPVLFSMQSLKIGGLFFQATKLVEIFNGFMFNLSNTVLFSLFINLDKKRKELISYLYVLFFLVSFGVVIPIMIGYGDLILTIFFGEEWSGINAIFCLLAIMNTNYVMDSSIRSNLKSEKLGRPILILEILKKAIIVAYLISFTFQTDISQFIYGLIICTSLGTFLSIVLYYKKINYKQYLQKYILIQVFILINLYCLISDTLLFSYLYTGALLLLLIFKAYRFEK